MNPRRKQKPEILAPVKHWPYLAKRALDPNAKPKIFIFGQHLEGDHDVQFHVAGRPYLLSLPLDSAVNDNDRFVSRLTPWQAFRLGMELWRSYELHWKRKEGTA